MLECLSQWCPGNSAQTSETHPANEFESVRHTKSLAKLAVGDVITSINSRVVSEDVLVEETLESIKPNERLILEITRKGETQTIVITATYLK